MFSVMAFAQEAAQAVKGPNLFEQMVPFIFLFVILWFLMIRPQQKKFKVHQDFLSKMRRGDEVLTAGGVFGRIEGITEKFVTLEIADGVRIRILKNQIASPVKEEAQK